MNIVDLSLIVLLASCCISANEIDYQYNPPRRSPTPSCKEQEDVIKAFWIVHDYDYITVDKKQHFKDLKSSLRCLNGAVGLEYVKSRGQDIEIKTKALITALDGPYTCQDNDYDELVASKDLFFYRGRLYVFLESIQHEVEKYCVTQLMMGVGKEDPTKRQKILTGMETLRDYMKRHQIVASMSNPEAKKYLSNAKGRIEVRDACFEAHQVKLQEVRDRLNFRRVVGNVYYELRYKYCSDEQSDCGKVLKEWDPIWNLCDPLQAYHTKSYSMFEKYVKKY